MKIITLEISSYTTGYLIAMLNSGNSITVTLTPEEKERITQIGREIFIARQQVIAKEIGEAQPFVMIELQPAINVSEDEIPF